MKLSILLSTIVSLIIFLYGIFYNKNESFYFIEVLPLVAIVFYSISFIKYKVLSKYIVFWIIYIQFFIRMTIIPYLIMIGSNVFFNINYLYVEYSIMMYCIECLVLSITLLSVKEKNHLLNFSGNILLHKQVAFLMFVLLIIILLDESFTKKINYIWSFKDYFKNVLEGEVDESSSLSNFFFPIVRLLGIGSIIYILSKSKTSNLFKFTLSSILVLFNASIIIGSSRFSIIYASIPLILFLIILYPSYKNIIIKFSILCFGLIIIISSIAKYSTHKEVDVESFLQLDQLNAYFSGIYNYNVGLESYFAKNSSFDEGYMYFISDYLKNIPILSKISNDNYQTATLFNNKIYGAGRNQDQIVPVSISSAYHLSFYLFFIPFFILSKLSFYWERIAFKQSNTVLFLCFITISFSCSTLMMINIGSITKTIFTYFIILIPAVKIMNKINFRNEKHISS